MEIPSSLRHPPEDNKAARRAVEKVSMATELIFMSRWQL
jgi:hypothetical protein